MEFRRYQQQLTAALKRRDAFLLLAVAAIVVNVLLGLCLLTHRDNARVIVVPAGFHQTFWVDRHGVSASYLTEMTRYVATLDLNMTPESGDYQIKQLLHYVTPEHYGAIKAALIARADKLKAENLSTAFFPVSVSANVAALTATITGDLTYFVGQQHTSTRRISYIAHYDYHEGHLTLMTFKEETHV